MFGRRVRRVAVLEATTTSTSTTTTTRPPTKLAAPTNLRWTVTDGTLALAWDPVAGADGYATYGTGFSTVKTTEPKLDIKLADIDATTHVDVAITAYETGHDTPGDMQQAGNGHLVVDIPLGQNE